MNPTVFSALSDWLAMIERSKAKATWKTYSSAASVFRAFLRRNKPLASLTESDYGEFIEHLKSYHARSEKLYATIIALFFEYLSAKGLHKVNMDYIRFTRRNETRKVGKRLRRMDMPAISEIAEKVTAIKPGKSAILARAKAFVLVLCRGGLRAEEATKLTLHDLDSKKMQGTVIGKGDKEARFIIDDDVLESLREYRAIHKVKTDYLFISHSRRHAKGTPRPIDTDTARRDVILICNLVLDRSPEYPITPHQFRHYFVSQIWRETGDIKLAQQLARHENIQTTENYIHLEDSDVTKAASKLKRKR